MVESHHYHTQDTQPGPPIPGTTTDAVCGLLHNFKTL